MLCIIILHYSAKDSRYSTTTFWEFRLNRDIHYDIMEYCFGIFLTCTIYISYHITIRLCRNCCRWFTESLHISNSLLIWEREKERETRGRRKKSSIENAALQKYHIHSLHGLVLRRSRLCRISICGHGVGADRYFLANIIAKNTGLLSACLNSS